MSDSSRQPLWAGGVRGTAGWSPVDRAAGAVVAVGGDPVDLLVAGVEAVGGVAGEGGRGRRPDERHRQAGEDLADVGPGGAVGRRRAHPGAVGRVVHAVGVAQEDGLAKAAHALGQLAQVDVVAALGDLGRARPVADGDAGGCAPARRPRPGASPAGTRTARRCGRWPAGGRCERSRSSTACCWAALPKDPDGCTQAPSQAARGVRASSPWAAGRGEGARRHRQGADQGGQQEPRR